MSATDDRWVRLQAVFRDAVAVPASDRSSFVQDACSDDLDLREEVLRLLAAHTRAETSDPPALMTLGDVIAAVEPAVTPGGAAGRYRLIREIGRGGMGVVYEAVQERPERTVALKMVRPEFISASTRRRFELEAHLLGRLDHPGIAQIFEAGVTATPTGVTVPFFAMELVDGLPVTAHARARDLSAHERLELLADIADIVHHAHQKGVVHRDLKPGNILVTASGAPKVLDFGVARALDDEGALGSMHTRDGQLLGTAPYMSPEQAGGDPAAVDTQSDVYALGVIGYELLAGRLPYDVSDRRLHEAVRIIREATPPRLGAVQGALRGDVETIIAKALEKDPDRRYAGARALADDIRRYLAREPILARRASRIYQLHRFAQRNRSLVAALVVVIASLAAAAVVSSWFAVHEHRARRDLAETNMRLETAVRIAEATNSFVRDDMLARADPRRRDGEPMTVQEMLRGAANAVSERFKDDPAVEAAVQLTIGQAFRSAGEAAEAVGTLSQAHALLVETEGADHPRTIRAAIELGAARRDAGEPAAALDIHRTTVAAIRAADEVDRRLLFDALIQLASSFLGRSAYDEAFLRLDEAAGLISGDAAADLTLLATRATALENAGRLPEAAVAFADALDGAMSQFGPRHPDTIILRYQLAKTQGRLGAYDEAVAGLLGVLETEREVMGPGSPGARWIQLALVDFYMKQARLEDAESLLQSMITVATNARGEDHAVTQNILGRLADLRRQQGRDAEAIPLYQRATEVLRRAYGERAPRVIECLSGLANAYAIVGRLDEAADVFEEVAELARDVHGEDHPVTLGAISTLGLVRVDRGEADEAVRLLSTALDGTRRLYGEGHPSTLIAMSNLASARSAQGDEAGAIALYETLEPQAREVMGRAHPFVLSVTTNRAVSLRTIGRLDEATTLFEEAVELVDEAFPPDHWIRPGVRAELADCYAQAGRFDEAEPIMAAAYREIVTLVGPDHPRAINLARLLELVHDAQRRQAALRDAENADDS